LKVRAPVSLDILLEDFLAAGALLLAGGSCRRSAREAFCQIGAP